MANLARIMLTQLSDVPVNGGNGADPLLAAQRVDDGVDALEAEITRVAQERAAEALRMHHAAAADAIRVGWRAIERAGGDPRHLTAEHAQIIQNIEDELLVLQNMEPPEPDRAFMAAPDLEKLRRAAEVAAAIRARKASPMPAADAAEPVTGAADA